jgi:hypothetical protein
VGTASAKALAQVRPAPRAADARSRGGEAHPRALAGPFRRGRAHFRRIAAGHRMGAARALRRRHLPCRRDRPGREHGGGDPVRRLALVEPRDP